MDMAGNPGTCGLSDVHANIQSIWRVGTAQQGFQALSEGHHLPRGGLGELSELVQVGIRHNHHVSGGIGERIEHHEAVFAAMDDQRLLVRHGGALAENASGSLVCGADVSVSPGSEKVVHRIVRNRIAGLQEE